jgi:WD40 repeat protein
MHPAAALAGLRGPRIAPDGSRGVAHLPAATVVDLRDGSTAWSVSDTESRDASGDSPIAFSPDARRIAVTLADHSIGIFDASSGHRLGSLEGHTETVFSVVYSPDGARIASAGRDRTIRIWDARHLIQVAELRGHTGYVWSLAFGADGSYLVSGSGDRTLRVWDTLSAVARRGGPGSAP